MSDIFNEITAEMRRERVQGLWSRYGFGVIGVSVSLIVLLAIGIAVDRWVETRHEGNSARYDAMLAKLPKTEIDVRVQALQEFAVAENNSYGALSALQAALALAETDNDSGALNSLDTLLVEGDLPGQILDFVRLQAAIIALDMGNSVEDVEARLARLLKKNNPLRPLALETLALANILNDNPLQARKFYQEILLVPDLTSFTRERVEVMLSEVEKNLSPGVAAKLKQSAAENKKN